VLSVAGSDPSGGAGIQADLKSFAAWRCDGMAVVTALTVQDTTGVRGIHAVPPAFVGSCIDALIEDCPPAATKTGMLLDAAIVEVVAERLAGGRCGPLVVDPVMVATSGDSLVRDDAVRAIVSRLLPLAALVTPNVPEAEVLAGRSVAGEDDAWDAAERIAALGPRAVLVKGGHLEGRTVADFLRMPDGKRLRFVRPRVPVARAHGTGCTLSAAIAAALARGLGLAEAAERAGDWVHAALSAARPVGRGAVPLDHLVPVPGISG
jgi:hydroxymethylpyrimidine/phosphomethylpyrimidine kinase